MAKGKYKSLIQAISLAGSELFHSNVWKWIMEQSDGVEFAKKFFPEIEQIVRVEREEQHRDITIWVKDKENENEDRAFVIENKFKSYASKRQLERYREDLKTKAKKKPKDKFLGGVLTGVVKPYWMSDVADSWKFVPYSEIVKWVKSYIRTAKELNPDEKSILEQYCEFTEEVINKAKSIAKKKKDMLCTAEDFNGDSDGSLWQKIVANQFANKLAGELCKIESLKIKESYELEVAPAFLHGEAIAYVYYKKYEGSGKKEKCSRLIGIEMQSGEYRYCAEVKACKDPDKVYENLVEKGWFPKCCTDECKRGGKKFKKFGSFVYRSRKASKDFTELVEMITKDMEKAKELIESLDAI